MSPAPTHTCTRPGGEVPWSMRGMWGIGRHVPHIHLHSHPLSLFRSLLLLLPFPLPLSLSHSLSLSLSLSPALLLALCAPTALYCRLRHPSHVPLAACPCRRPPGGLRPPHGAHQRGSHHARSSGSALPRRRLSAQPRRHQRLQQRALPRPALLPAAPRIRLLIAARHSISASLFPCTLPSSALPSSALPRLALLLPPALISWVLHDSALLSCASIARGRAGGQ
ncbi:unnamed protein product [Closterium sp. Yama58-4]|nr:unnamed protein product [Closterium sp. Yama58-4]